MNKIIKIIIVFILCPSIAFAKNFYKIVIDPGHSYKDAEQGSKVGPKFEVNGEKVYAIIKDGTEKENIIYDFKRESEIPSSGWKEFEYQDKKGVKHTVGFVEAVLNLEVAKELTKLLNNDPDERFVAILTRDNHKEMRLSERASVAIQNTDLFLSIHFNAASETPILQPKDE